MKEWLNFTESASVYVTHGGLLGKPLSTIWPLLRAAIVFVFRAGAPSVLSLLPVHVPRSNTACLPY